MFLSQPIPRLSCSSATSLSPITATKGNSFCCLSRQRWWWMAASGEEIKLCGKSSYLFHLLFYFKQLQWSAWHPTLIHVNFARENISITENMTYGGQTFLKLNAATSANSCRNVLLFCICLPEKMWHNHSLILQLLQSLLCSHSWFQDDGVLQILSSCLAPLCNTTCKTAK